MQKRFGFRPISYTYWKLAEEDNLTPERPSFMAERALGLYVIDTSDIDIENEVSMIEEGLRAILR